MIEKALFSFVVIINCLLRVLTYKINTSVRHNVIKACNNKIEQGEIKITRCFLFVLVVI